MQATIEKIWQQYTEMKDVLSKAGLPDHRLPIHTDFVKRAEKTHKKILQKGVKFLNKLDDKEISEWRRIRSQLPEESWILLFLQGGDNSFQEIKAIRKVEQRIRSKWVNSKENVLRRVFINGDKKKKDRPKRTDEGHKTSDTRESKDSQSSQPIVK